MDIGSNEKDEIIIKKIQSGNPECFDILYNRYHSRVGSIISRYVHTTSDIDDVSQEVFINVFKYLDGFRGDSSFYTWLYRITVNVSKKYLDKHKRILPEVKTEYRESYENFDSARTDDKTPERILIGKEEFGIVKIELSNLSCELREAITLRYTQDMSYKDIAKNSECPLGTAKSRVFRSRHILQDKLDEANNKE